MLSTNVGCTVSDVLDFLILREVWPLVMLLPKSCIFLTDLLNLRLREVLREGSSVELFTGTLDVLVDEALETPLSWDKKLGVRPRWFVTGQRVEEFVFFSTFDFARTGGETLLWGSEGRGGSRSAPVAERFAS